MKFYVIGIMLSVIRYQKSLRTYAMYIFNAAEVAVLTSDKIDFKEKTLLK